MVPASTTASPRHASTLLVGHSAGAYYVQGFAARRPDRVAGLALVCPLLAGVRDVPEHHPVVAAHDLGDEEFRGYFVVQTPAMFERYERFVAPAVPLADAAAMERIARRWELTVPEGPAQDQTSERPERRSRFGRHRDGVPQAHPISGA